MKFIFKFLIGILAFILFIVIMLVITFIILINMTPRKLKIEEKPIVNDKTCLTIGIADTKFKTLINDFKKITRAKDVVKNPYTDADKTKAEELMNKVGAFKDGNIDYEYIEKNGINQDSKYYITLNDTTMAYMLNNMVESISEDSSSMTLSLEEITMSGTNKEMRIIFSTDISEFKKGLEEKIPGFIANFIGIPEKVYVACYYDVTVTAEGKLELSYKDMKLSDIDTKLSEAVIKTFSSEDMDIEQIANQFGDGIEETVYQLGKIGSAVADENGAITGTVTLGEAGYEDGKIHLICGIA